MDRVLLSILGAWLLAALAASAAGLVERLLGPGVPATILTLASAATLASFLVPAVRDSVQRLGPAWPVAFHMTRFVGVYFLWMASEGRLDPAWARLAGYGDIAVAVLAIVLLATGLHRRRVPLLIWNTLGVIDMLFVIAGAARLMFTAPESMRPMTELPLALLPTFVVPVILCTHVLVYVHAKRWTHERTGETPVPPKPGQSEAGQPRPTSSGPGSHDARA
ncbi:MAG: hypothetical protein HBSAPP03_08350 [Phycisphaerae bacterium]|nr:MAG: hypothetical protein HBSAPP03_08350 [Phycisphaerae bacterium]